MSLSRLRGLAIDLEPLRVSKDYRRVWFGQLVSHTGSQITVVALFVQIYDLTRSAAAVGLIGLFQLVALVVASIGGGAIVDRLDRRKILIVCEVGFAVLSGVLLLNAIQPSPSVAVVYIAGALIAGLVGIDLPARVAMTPRLVGEKLVPSALALGQVMYNATSLIGPAIGGLVIAQLGLGWAYGIDVVSFGAAVVATVLLPPLPPQLKEGEVHATGLTADPGGIRVPEGPARAPVDVLDRPRRDDLRHAPGAVPDPRAGRLRSRGRRARACCSRRRPPGR